MIRILFLVCFITKIVIAQSTVAITEFKNTSDVFRFDTLEKTVPEYLKTRLSKSKNIVLVERTKLADVLNEQALSQTGLIDSARIQEFGKLTGAQYVINGTISQTGKKIRIDANLIRVSTGQVRSEKVIGNEENLHLMMDLLGNNILNILSGETSYLNKIKIKKYPTTSFLIATAGLGALTMLAHSAYQTEYDKYKSETKLNNFSDQYDKANNLNKTKIVLASLTGTALLGTIWCWLGNRSPEEVIAQYRQSNIKPSFYCNQEGKIFASVKISF